MAYAKRRKSEGASDPTVARELGLSEMTIKRWGRRVKGSAAMVESP